MIIEFRVANFLSIKDEQTLSFVAGTGKKIENEHHCISALDGKRPISLLKTMALYGPNAAGKSNFLVALRAMIRIIRDSNRLNTGEMIKDIVPYAFNRESREQPSLFELTFLVKEEKRLIRYQYGFRADKNKVHEEWLISYPEGAVERFLIETTTRNPLGRETLSKDHGMTQAFEPTAILFSFQKPVAVKITLYWHRSTSGFRIISFSFNL